MKKEVRIYKQLKLWFKKESKTITNKVPNLDISSNKVSILFRNTISEIPLTTYGTFAIYKYTAKFILQVIAYVLKKIC